MTEFRKDRTYTKEELEAWREVRRSKMINRSRNRRVYSFFIAIAVIVMAFGVAFLMNQDSVQRKFYPLEYRTTITHYANWYHVDKSLVAAVIQSESKFKHAVESDRGAVGLMQLMPSTAKWISEEIDDKSFSIERLREPDMNIRYGTWYLASLKDEFRGNEVLMLAAYNAGRGNVHEWMEDYGWGYDFKDIDAIPYRETAAYVRDVLKNQEKYRSLYGD